MSYKGPGVKSVSRLIYPCPSQSIDHLGVHLVSCSHGVSKLNNQTLDLDGNVRFGPDAVPIGDATTSSLNPDHWLDHLSVTPNEHFGPSIQDYLPGIDPSKLEPDYAGIRPNIAPAGSGFSDFLVRRRGEGMIECLGFNSPGLTSALAVGEMVAGMVLGPKVEESVKRWWQ